MLTMFFISVSQTVFKKNKYAIPHEFESKTKTPPQKKPLPTIIKDFISSHIFLMIKVAAVSGLYAVAWLFFLFQVHFLKIRICFMNKQVNWDSVSYSVMC